MCNTKPTYKYLKIAYFLEKWIGLSQIQIVNKKNKSPVCALHKPNFLLRLATYTVVLVSIVSSVRKTSFLQLMSLFNEFLQYMAIFEKYQQAFLIASIALCSLTNKTVIQDNLEKLFILDEKLNQMNINFHIKNNKFVNGWTEWVLFKIITILLFLIYYAKKILIDKSIFNNYQYFIFMLYNISMNLSLITWIVVVQERFEQLNEVLRENRIYIKNNSKILMEFSVVCNTLNDIIRSVNNFYSFPIAISLSTNLIAFTAEVYIFSSLLFVDHHKDLCTLQLCIATIWLTYNLIDVFFLVLHCHYLITSVSIHCLINIFRVNYRFFNL